MDTEHDSPLTAAGISPTPTRILIWREIAMTDRPFSLSDLETSLDTVDKSTIFRTLSLFLEKNLIHEIDDGSGSRKYCRCTCPGPGPHLSHIHFYCTACHRTYCIKNIAAPRIPMPEGFVTTQASYVLKGLCPKCRHLQMPQEGSNPQDTRPDPS